MPRRDDTDPQAALARTLALLADYRPLADTAGPAAPGPTAQALATLVPAILHDIATAPPLPRAALRSLHHFACTGGTLISRCVAALPNVVLLSEIDPLSRMHLRRQGRPFFPTDIIVDLLLSPRGGDAGLIADVFAAGLEALIAGLALRGQHLVLRDHAHSHFCVESDPADRPTVRSMITDSTRLQGRGVHSVVTVRHPLDSFLSLENNRWNTFSPFTLAEYARRYAGFLDAHADLAIIKYEDFVTEPAATLARIAALLDLTFDPAALQLFVTMQLSGNSGRSGEQFALRPRREVRKTIQREMHDSADYRALCARLDYDPT